MSDLLLSILWPPPLARAGVLLGLSGVAALLAHGCSQPAAPEPPGPVVVTIGQAQWHVEIAQSEPQQRKGLAGRQEIPPGTGMLFVWKSSQIRYFWMKDCLTSIDVAFLEADGRIVAIHTMPPPQPGTPDEQLRTYSSRVPAMYALEVAGGTLREAGVAVGDYAQFSRPVP